MSDEFDTWLTSELDRGLSMRRPAPSFGAPRRRRGLTLKAATLAVAAVLVTGGVALAAGTAVTGTPNPAVWGQQVQSHVDACRQQLASGQHGLGGCVSAFARQHGKQQQAAHGHGAGSQGAGAAKGHGHGHAAGVRDTPGVADSPEPAESPGS